jgi:hypothetical protein
MSISIENEYASYRLVEGILYVSYHKDVILDLPAAVYIVKDRLSIHEGRYFPVLCDIRQIKEINKAARTYLSIEGSILIKAVAFITESPVSEILSEFYMRTSKPPIPTQSFNNMEEALRFLNKFKEHIP